MRRIFQATLLVAALSGFGFLAVPAAHSGCGDEVEGTWDSGAQTCSGAHRNCTTVTVCPPAK